MKWTMEHDDILINGQHKTCSELAALVGHTVRAVQTRLNILRNRGVVINPIGSSPRWSDDEERIFDNNIRTGTLDDLCKLFPTRTRSSIKGKCCREQKFPINKDITGKNSWRFTGYERLDGRRINSYKLGAKQRGLKFSVTPKYLWKLLEKQNFRCALSGLPIDIFSPHKTTASPDRIDVKKGYIEGNIQWVHVDVNFAKQSMTNDEFIALCKIIASKWS